MTAASFEPFELRGVTKPFRGNGRKIGFPTANIEIPNDTEEGIFAGWVQLRGERRQATIFVGAPITMHDPIKRAEAHILDYPDEDLYGEDIVMEVLYKLRENQMYDSVSELSDQLQKDNEKARQILAAEKE